MRATAFILSVFAASICFAQTGKLITVDLGIERMTVYLNGGEVRTSADVDLVAGSTPSNLRNCRNTSTCKACK